MLDLMGRRLQAMERYQQAADMNLKDSWTHSQYRLQYELSAYARERMERPFIRIENCQD